MRKTLDLVQAAKDKTGLSERRLADQLGLSQSALAVARTRGSLSPVIAGQLANLLGENVEHWMALAALESEPRSRVTDHLRRIVSTAAGVLLATILGSAADPSLAGEKPQATGGALYIMSTCMETSPGIQRREVLTLHRRPFALRPMTSGR